MQRLLKMTETALNESLLGPALVSVFVVAGIVAVAVV